MFTETDRKLPREQGSLTMTPFFVTDIVSVLGALVSFESKNAKNHNIVVCETQYGTFTAQALD